jgi:hypothetical protein
MSDPSTDEALRNAFAELRSGERPHFAPPGAQAARQTIRRRRRWTATASAGLTAVMLLGAGYLAGTRAGGQPDPDGDSLPAPAIAASDTEVPASDESPGTLEAQSPDLSRLLADAMAGDAEEGHIYAVMRLGYRLSVFPGRVDGGPITITGGDAGLGEYLFRIACAGADGVSVTALVGDGETRTEARCGTTVDAIAAGIGETTIVLDETGPVAKVVLDPDQADRDGVMLALALVPR